MTGQDRTGLTGLLAGRLSSLCSTDCSHNNMLQFQMSYHATPRCLTANILSLRSQAGWAKQWKAAKSDFLLAAGLTQVPGHITTVDN
jgi:hypothetical protein